MPSESQIAPYLGHMTVTRPLSKPSQGCPAERLQRLFTLANGLSRLLRRRHPGPACGVQGGQTSADLCHYHQMTEINIKVDVCKVVLDSGDVAFICESPGLNEETFDQFGMVHR